MSNRLITTNLEGKLGHNVKFQVESEELQQVISISIPGNSVKCAWTEKHLPATFVRGLKYFGWKQKGIKALEKYLFQNPENWRSMPAYIDRVTGKITDF